MINKMTLAKIFLVLLSLLMWLGAAALMYMGVWMYMSFGGDPAARINQHTWMSLVPAAVLMAVSLFFIIIGMLGLVGSLKESKATMIVYCILLLLVLASLIVVTVLCFFYRGGASYWVRNSLKRGLENYGTEPVWTEQMDFLQNQMRCCGIDNSTDWLGTVWHNKTHLPYPGSCCDGNCTYTVRDQNLYTDGCYSAMAESFRSNWYVAAIVAGFVAVVPILGLCCTCILLRARSRHPYVDLNDPSGLRI